MRPGLCLIQKRGHRLIFMPFAEWLLTSTSGILPMTDFTRTIPEAIPADTKGWLTSILELGAWFGTLCTAYIADSIGRKRGIQVRLTLLLTDSVDRAGL